MKAIATAMACAAMAAVALLPAAAQDDKDQVMGIYKGGPTTSGYEDYSLRAEVIARGEKKYDAALYVSAGWDEMLVVVPGEATEEKKAAKFEGEVDLGYDLGGTYQVQGQIQDGVFTGSFSNNETTVDFKLEKQEIKPPTLGAEPPEGAIMLFDGQDLSKWETWPHEKWALTGNAMQVASNNLITKQELGDAKYHIEFMTPFMPNETGQARGNSGVYLQGRYEVQVLDSFGMPPAWNEAGGIYKQSVPTVNASLPPLEWQTYDITFTSPKFDDNGNKTSNARITVVYNGEVIHDDVELTDATPGGVSAEEAAKGPLLLQHHRDPVSYRNIWVQPLD